MHRTPLPGTELGDYAVQNGMIDPANLNRDKLGSLARFPKDESEFIHVIVNMNAQKLLKKVRLVNFLM